MNNIVCQNTGSLAPGSNTTVYGDVVIPQGYKLIGASPRYSGDDQFAFINCYAEASTSRVYATVQNVSSSADSGSPQVFAILIKT